MKDDYDAYLLFETLNDRGLALTVADLLKNYLFSRSEDRLTATQSNWKTMSENLEQIEVKRFLRHYWLSKHGVVREKYLYKKITDSVNTKIKIYDFSKQLRDSSEYYAALHDSEHLVWSIFDEPDRSQIKKLIGELNIFGVNQYNPLLLSVLEENHEIFRSVLSMSVAFAFRYSIILGRGAGNIEKTFASAAQFVRSNPACTAAEVFGKIDSLYPLDKEFANAFAEITIKQAAISRYILKKLNDHLDSESGLEVKSDAYAMNLEHILPQKYNSSDWINFIDIENEEIDEYIHRLGNLTLLPSSTNRKISNSSFLKKKTEGYLTDNPLKISESILLAEDWTCSKIKDRQAKLAEYAQQIWRVDY